MTPRFSAASLLLLALANLATAAEPLDGPLSPADAPKSFQLEPGLKIELVAAEPLVVAPVAMAFDEKGRLFVAENRGYPSGLPVRTGLEAAATDAAEKAGEPMGRIAMLEDTDGDGRMDKRHEFAAGLTFPNGVLPWDGGLIVTCAPDILFLKDTDGDGKADERRVLFTGFATTGSTQLRCSHPTLSLDGWIYVTGGLSGGKVTCPHPPVADAPGSPKREPVEFKKADFRFRPDLSEYEAADGGGQFGMSFDDFGRRFICYNRVQVQHVVLSSKVLRRNPHLAFSETVENCPADLAPEPLSGHGRAARLYPISTNVTTADSHAGTFTAACGLHIYRGTGLPERFRGCAFSCDPTGNLIHADRLEPNGATFKALPLLDKREFLASTDNWFRPVFLTNGPDGALYVCDMYRKTIEHPDYLPVEIRKHTDFESGREMGRIWRITSDGKPVGEDSLGNAPRAKLVAALQSENGWHRDTAHRLLMARGSSAAEAVRQLARDPQASPQSVTVAMHLLYLANDLDADTLRESLSHPSPGVRENALQLLEPRLAKEPEWVPEIARALPDASDARVVFQAFVCFGGTKRYEHLRSDAARRFPAVMADIMRKHSHDRWTRAAAWSALRGRERKFAEEVLEGTRGKPFSDDCLRELGTLWAMGDGTGVGSILSRIASRDRAAEDRLLPLLTGIGDGLRRQNIAAGDRGVLHAAVTPGDEATHKWLDGLCSHAVSVVDDARASSAARTAALAFLAYGPADQGATLLKNLLSSNQSEPVKRAAVRSLGAMRGAVEVLLDFQRFEEYSPALREEVLAVVLTQPVSTAKLLDSIEAGKLSLATLDALRRRQLREHRDPTIKNRAAKLFEAVTGDRAKVYEEWKSVAEMPGEAAKGRIVFAKHCASCHRLDREGFAVGPDLFGIRNQPKAAILLHILVPEQEITQGFTAYMAETKDGRVFVGLLAGETDTSITIRQPLGKEETILRTNLERLAASPLSLMPQGVEKTLTRQDLADLLAYLKGEK